VKEQLTREPLPFPTVTLNPLIDDIDNFTTQDITLENYQSHDSIKGEIANIGGFSEQKKS
jgi:thymidylate synthase